MKAIIEKSLKGKRSDLNKWQHFNEILDAIQLSKTEDEKSLAYRSLLLCYK